MIKRLEIHWQPFFETDVAGALIDPDEPERAIYSHISSDLNWLLTDLTTGFPCRCLELMANYPDGYVVELVAMHER